MFKRYVSVAPLPHALSNLGFYTRKTLSRNRKLIPGPPPAGKPPAPSPYRAQMT